MTTCPDLITERRCYRFPRRKLHLVKRVVAGREVMLQCRAMRALQNANERLHREEGISILVGSNFRSCAEQERLYQAYLAGDSQWPAAPPGQSYHNIGLAIDVANWADKRVREALMDHGWNWGSPFGDQIHFSYQVKG